MRTNKDFFSLNNITKLIICIIIQIWTFSFSIYLIELSHSIQANYNAKNIIITTGVVKKHFIDLHAHSHGYEIQVNGKNIKATSYYNDKIYEEDDIIEVYRVGNIYAITKENCIYKASHANLLEALSYIFVFIAMISWGFYYGAKGCLLSFNFSFLFMLYLSYNIL